MRNVRGFAWWRVVGWMVAVAGPLAGRGSAQTDPPMDLPRLPGAIELDGRPDEAAWAEVPALPLTMYAPTFGGTPEQRTEIKVAYDDRFLYAAGWFYDTEPGGIRINSLYRDRWSGDDAFAIYVDAFNDNQSARWFGVTAAAMRFDQLVSDDGATLHGNWDTFWDAATTITDQGWFAEVRIPFSSLGFQTDADGRATMGLTVTRLVSRTGERVTFPAIDPKFEFRQPSVAQDVLLAGVESAAPVYVTPYVLGGVDRLRVPNEGGMGFATRRSGSREVGVDVRYPLSGNLTLDLTANTDFAQVEADDQQVNLDRFSLFFPEKRRFFQERSGIFEFTTGAGSRLFHSRRIGITDDNAPVPVLGGARLVGRVGLWDVGVLSMQTDDAPGVDTENFGAARIRRRVFNANSFVGAMATSRLRSGDHSLATGVDTSLRLRGDDYLTLKWAGSFDAETDPAPADRSHVNARWERRVNEGLGYSLEYTRSGSDYRPALGFLPRRDYSQANALANWYFFAGERSPLRRIWPGLLAFSTFRNSDGSLESGTYAVWVQWETKGGGGGWIEPKLFVEDVLTPFGIGGEVDIPAGRYEYADLQVALSMASGRPLRTSLDFRTGTFFDGTRTQIIVGPTWNASPHLELGADGQWTRLRFEERDQSADIFLARVRVRAALDSRASGNAFLQYNSTTDRLDLNLRFRYNFVEGRDLWIVFNEGLVTERLPDPREPRLPRSMSRTLIVKYTHTFGG